MEEFYLKLVNYTLILVTMLIMMSTIVFRSIFKNKISVSIIYALIGIILCGFFSETIQNGITVVYILFLIALCISRRKLLRNLHDLFKAKLSLFLMTVFLIGLNQFVHSVVLLSFIISLTTILIVLRLVNNRYAKQIKEANSLNCFIDVNISSVNAMQSGENLKEILAAIHSWFQETECYLDSNYSIDQLEKDLKINRKLISLAINKLGGENFYRFIAFYRIEYAKKMILNNDKYTLETLSTECGFCSKSTFNKYFKIFEGQTPSSYKLSCS